MEENKEVVKTEQIQKKIASNNEEIEKDVKVEQKEENVKTVKLEEQPKQTETKIAIKNKDEITEDAKATKNIAWLAYILFFIPLLINKNSEFVKHNANEGLEINIFDFIGIILTICGTCIITENVATKMFLIICTIVGLGLLILTLITKIYMIAVSLKGKKVSTPWFWDIKIIK